MALQILWFIIIAVLFIGFFFLEGFDFGVGILTPFVGKTDEERRLIINTIGPFWDANEVWFITAGGAMFAAFPGWYATLFSGFYIALFLLLIALIGRGVAFEFRSKVNHPTWRHFWDWVIFGGSVLPPLLWGIALANMMHGVPIDKSLNYVGSFWNLINLYSIAGGLSVTLLFILHGALFISLRTTGVIQQRARDTAMAIGAWATALTFLFVILSYLETDMFTRHGIDPGTVPILAGLALFSVQFFIRAKRDGWAFFMTGLTIILSTITVFMDLFPRVMVSSLNPAWSLTIFNTASNPYSLKVMSIVALTVVPFVLLYQGWSYWVFRKRLSDSHSFEY
ncbi:cytochrome d ubiquinol oxidase, subunit II [Alicyclobacillus hesperidum URH17-3-68]|uniref:Cytochrome c oxidase assembly protein n=1 Tax=Alicyclobacillus hesperidum TaxID=89784 RepID=A0AA37U4Y3_9BACL|nr:cytochrome d ubiquinol oxidase subunit II [Alicyclobacillus hesperidum]EJY56371.1 cytochrome d ubiquinol oxidase, subunit II [Alicyclobacillus hesperidum URH17-3-68]GLV14970.1 cytochrome c oxidase assembly protein [Alicyclobacillus hesperidum]